MPESGERKRNLTTLVFMPPPAAAAATARVSAGPVHADIAADSVDELPAVALAERVGDFNISIDLWEQTGAAPQGWAAHVHQTVIPVQGYIQLRPQDTTLPSFGSGPPATVATADENLSTEVAVRDGGGKASPSVSIFSRVPLCSHTCRHCRCKPCDIATEHDDHICYNCEQRILLGRTCLWRTVSDSISGAENCTVTRRSSAHWPVMSEGSKHVCSINCCIRSWLDIFPPV